MQCIADEFSMSADCYRCNTSMQAVIGAQAIFYFLIRCADKAITAMPAASAIAPVAAQNIEPPVRHWQSTKQRIGQVLITAVPCSNQNPPRNTRKAPANPGNLSALDHHQG